MKPLYLDGVRPLRVQLDGPGLRVCAVGVADRMYPLQRLSRVVVCGQVDWATDALLACAEAGIPVSFMRRNGILRARMLGVSLRKHLLQLDTLLEEFIGLPDGVDRYRDWVRGRSQQARLELVCGSGRGPWPSESRALAQLLRQHAKQYTRSAELARFDSQVRALVRIHMETTLHRFSLDPDATQLMVQDIFLTDDLSEILMWKIQNVKLTWLKRAHNRLRRLGEGLAQPGLEQAIRFLESRDTALDFHSTDLIRDLQVFLHDSVYNHGIR